MKTLLGWLLCAVLVASGESGLAQVTLRLRGVPQFYTPLVDGVHVAGTFNGWDPGVATGAMTRLVDGSFEYVLTGTPGQTVEYKYARGDWARVETQLNGTFQPNRSFVYANGLTIVDTVWNWQDMLGWHTAVGNTHIVTMDFALPQFGRTRRIWVYLPQTYWSSTDSFPVLYMHDGQNLFDAVTTAFGTEWAVDEAMEMLQDSGYAPAIVVGLDNGGSDRIAEYTPWAHPQHGGGDGELYMDWVVNNVKPWVDGYFRTRRGRLHTGLMGSSLGGLISLYGGLEYQSVFGKIGVFSPSFWYSDTCYAHTANAGRQGAMRIYLLAGGQESATMVSDMQAMEDTLLAAGFLGSEVRTVVKADGQHSEWFWAREFPEAYKWLFADLSTGMTNPVKEAARYRVVPSVIGDSFRVAGPEGGAEDVRLVFYDLRGEQVREMVVRVGGAGTVERLGKGSYLVKILGNGDQYWQRVVVY